MNVLETPKKCEHKNIFNSDYIRPLFSAYGDQKIKVINRHCRICNHHWHGKESNVTEYTAKQWDELMNATETPFIY